MKTNITEVYLQIAGFVLRLSFCMDASTNAKAVHSLRELIQPFLIKKPKTKIDYSVEFFAREGRELEGRESFISKNNIYVRLCLIDKKKHFMKALFPISLYEINMILRYILFELLSHSHSFSVHMSAVQTNGGALLFLGDNGAGKSTLMRLLSSRMNPLCDDLGFLRKEKGQYLFYQTPYKEKNPTKKYKKGVPIKRIFFIHKADAFMIKKIPYEKIGSLIERYTRQIIVNKNKKDIFMFVMSHIDMFYDLYFSKDDADIAKKTYNHIAG